MTIEKGDPQKDEKNSPNAQTECFEALKPPTDKKLKIKDPLSLVFQTILILLMILPSILYSLFRKIVPPRGKSLKDKVVLVTGAGRGLGRGFALGFAAEGAHVAVVDIDKNSASITAQDIVAAGGKAKAYVTNVARSAEIHSLRCMVTEDLGSVDILLNNAGLIFGSSISDMSESDIRGVIEVNLLSHFLMVKEFLPAMKKQGSGHIVAICSGSALCGLAKGTAYSSCKSGVMGFMDSLQEELKTEQNNEIKTTTVFPYFVNTSADYIDAWDIRLPAISIEEVVDATISAVKRDEVCLSVPGHLYSTLHLIKSLPQNVIDYTRKVFYARIIIPPKELEEKSPQRHILNNFA